MNCPVCKSTLKEPPSPEGKDRKSFDCEICGRFILSGTAESLLPPWLHDHPDKAPIVSHTLRKMQMMEDWPYVDWDVCKRVIETGDLPTPQEQADNLVRWLGENLPGPGESLQVGSKEHQAIIGARTPAGVMFVLDGLTRQGLLSGPRTSGKIGVGHVTLTFAGWARYEELRRGVPSGRKAFMAMQFGDSKLDAIVDGHFRPAVTDTGFILQRLDDVPKAGLIDDRLRVEIQSARFLVVDLTHGNKGAYWEAGYAEGLGKPVIYTCEEAAFATASHFDTNHHLTVIWTEGDPKGAADRLKATIRATIPEAKREDG